MAAACFSELAEVMLGLGGVTSGRSFGRACLKFGKRAFIVLDARALAFHTGAESGRLLAEIPKAWAWNPYNYSRPKDTWVACPPEDSDAISRLAVGAYEWVRRKGGAGA